MKKILVFSDSHGYSYGMIKAIEAHRGQIDTVIFLGDGLADIDYVMNVSERVTFCSVAGNCDGFHIFSGGTTSVSEMLLDFGGKKFFITHGHRFDVKSGYSRLAEYAAAKGADIALFGHTHEADDTTFHLNGDKSIRLFNPGSCRSSYYGTFGLIEVVGDNIMTGFGELRQL